MNPISAKRISRVCFMREENPQDAPGGGPGNIAELRRQAAEAFKGGHFPQAGRLYQRALAASPRNPDILFNLGLVSSALRNPVMAESYFTQAITANPNFFDAYASRGLLRAQNPGQLFGAEADFTQCLRLRPNHLLALYNRGFVRLQQQTEASLRGAISDFTFVINSTLDDGHRLSATVNRGNAYLILKQWQEAAQDFRGVLSIEPGNMMARNGLGLVCQRLGHFDSSIREFQAAVGGDPVVQRAAYENLAVVFSQRGDPGDREAGERAILSARRIRPQGS